MPLPQDFTSAVMDVDYSPTGREFVAGSYDRSLRIFGHTGGHSREASAAMHFSQSTIMGLFNEGQLNHRSCLSSAGDINPLIPCGPLLATHGTYWVGVCQLCPGLSGGCWEHARHCCTWHTLCACCITGTCCRFFSQTCLCWVSRTAAL